MLEEARMRLIASSIWCMGVVGSNRDFDEDGGRMRARVRNKSKVSSPLGVGRILCSPGIIKM
jgi:hypothetical protein